MNSNARTELALSWPSHGLYKVIAFIGFHNEFAHESYSPLANQKAAK